MLDPNDKMPSIAELEDETGLSPKTISKAYRLLEEEGVVRIHPSLGTFVAPPG